MRLTAQIQHLRQGLSMPPAGWTLAGLLAFYVFAGLVGHDPWKTEDAVHLGVAWDVLSQGHWLMPELAGRPWPEPPLYYWSAALSGQFFSLFGLPVHSAMRLASGLWVALALTGIYFAGRELYGQEAAGASPLLLAGSFGLMVHAHEAQPLLVGLAAYCAALGALAAVPRRPYLAGTWYACALSAAVLGIGLWLTLPLLLTGVLLALLKRTRNVFLGLSFSLVLFAAIMAAVLLPTLQIQGDIWQYWWSFEVNNPPWQHPPRGAFTHYISILPWFAWPAFPVACWGVWSKRRQLDTSRLLQPLVIFLLTLVVMLFAYRPRNLLAILLLPTLALLATPAVLQLRRGAANALDWFSRMTFTLFVILVWVGWCAMVWGWPERLAQRVVILEPGFVGQFQAFPVALAATVTLWWVWLMLTLSRSAFRGLTMWTAGFTTFWLLVVSLWLPWIDYGKSYRLLSNNLAQQINSRPLPMPSTDNDGATLESTVVPCVAERAVGNAQRASFAYFANLHLEPWDSAAAQNCSWLLIQGSSRKELAPPNTSWQKIWEGNRQGDKNERFRLYYRQTKA